MGCMFYVEPLTLHVNKNRGQYLLSLIVLVPVLVPVSVPDTASVITPLVRLPVYCSLVACRPVHRAGRTGGYVGCRAE